MPKQTTLTNLSSNTVSTAAMALQSDAAHPVPEWVHLVPAGEFSGRDGRGPYTLSADAVQSAFASWGADLAIDYEHQTFLVEQNGEPAPAAGWIKALEQRDDGLWGQVAWTERAGNFIAAQEYRYLSPVFDYDKKTGAVLRLLGAGLTNNPNLVLTALNRQLHTYKEKAMDELLERLRYMFNLPVLATPEELQAQLQRVIDALNAPATEAMRADLAVGKHDLPGLLTAAHDRLRAEPDRARYVPRAEFDAVAHTLAELERNKSEEDVNRAIHAAMDAGKLLPAHEQMARAMCAQGGLKAFQEFIESTPVVAPIGDIATHARAANMVPGDQDSGFIAPAKALVSQDALALHSKTLAYQREHGGDFVAAYKAVGGK